MSVLLIPVSLSRLTLGQHCRPATSVTGYTFYPMLPRPFGEPRVSFGPRPGRYNSNLFLFHRLGAWDA